MRPMACCRHCQNQNAQYKRHESIVVVGIASHIDFALGQAAGDTGTALTDLRPAGAASIGGKRVDVVTQGEYISKGQEIEVMLIEGQRVVVWMKNK